MDCKKDRLVETHGMLKTSYEKQAPCCRSCGNKKQIENKGRIKRGDKLSLGFKHSEETKMKQSLLRKGKRVSIATEFIKGMIPWNKGIAYMQDENHPNWKGDQVGYNAIHTWIQRKLGKPTMCEKCGKDGLSGHKIHWANISGEYKRNFNDWKRLCSTCHLREHKNWEARWLVI